MTAPWTRRDALRALARSAWVPVGAKFLLAPSVGAARTPPPNASELADRLRSAVDVLGKRHPDATGRVVVRATTTTAIDADEARRDFAFSNAVHLAAGGRTAMSTSTEPGAFSQCLQALGGPALPSSRRSAKRRVFGSHVKRDTSSLRERFEYANTLGGSRIIYRVAHHVATDELQLYADKERTLQQRLVRYHTSVHFLVWNGEEVQVETAESFGQGRSFRLPDETLRQAAGRAQALARVGASIDTATVVVLSPDALGGLLHRALHSRVAPTLAQVLTITNDPRLPGAYGSSHFDERGREATQTTLVQNGSPKAVAPGVSNLVVAPGTLALEELVSNVKNGVFVDRVSSVRQSGDRATLLVPQAQEIRAGDLTGRVFRRTVVTDSDNSMLAGVSALGRKRRTLLPAGPHEFQTISSPHAITTARVSSL